MDVGLDLTSVKVAIDKRLRNIRCGSLALIIGTSLSSSSQVNLDIEGCGFKVESSGFIGYSMNTIDLGLCKMVCHHPDRKQLCNRTIIVIGAGRIRASTILKNK